MEFKIPFKTPTVNLMYSTFRGRRIKSKEARLLSKEFVNIVNQTEILKGKLKVTIDVYSNWYTQIGKIRIRDLANLEKFITDSVFAELKEMDDSQIFKLSMNKIQSDKEFSIIKIGVIDE